MRKSRDGRFSSGDVIAVPKVRLSCGRSGWIDRFLGMSGLTRVRQLLESVSDVKFLGSSRLVLCATWHLPLYLIMFVASTEGRDLMTLDIFSGVTVREQMTTVRPWG